MNAPHVSKPQWLRFLITIGELRPTLAWGVSLFWMACGGSIVLVGMRVIVLDKLVAQTTADHKEFMRLDRADSTNVAVDTAQEIEIHMLQAQSNRIEAHQAVAEKALCIDHSKTQQQVIGLICPPDLYKGAK